MVNAAVTAAKAAARAGVGGEYGGGSALIEIPGQYCPNTSSSVDIKPCPELHAKLIKFEPFVEVLRRNDQAPALTHPLALSPWHDDKHKRTLLNEE